MCVCVCVLSHFSHVCLFVTLWTVTHQAPLSMGFSRQEYWSELPCPPPGDLLNPGTEPTSLFPALADGFFITSATWEAPKIVVLMLSHVQLFVTPWTVAHQAPLSMGIFQARILEWVATAFSMLKATQVKYLKI